MRFSYVPSFFSQSADRFVPSPEIHTVQVDTWADFRHEVESFTTLIFEHKAQAPLLSPAFYIGEQRRKNVNVSGWEYLALDIDGNEDCLTYKAMKDALDVVGYKYIMYTTASHSDDRHKYRVLIPFDGVVLPHQMAQVWQGAYIMFNEMSDPQCKDRSRAYYVPWAYPDVPLLFDYSDAGCVLEVDTLISLAPPPVEPVATIPFVESGITFDCGGLDACKLVQQRWVDEYLRHTGPGHYKMLFVFMMRIAGAAKAFGYAISVGELAGLADALDMRKDGRWREQGRDFQVEAQRALSFVGVGGNV